MRRRRLALAVVICVSMALSAAARAAPTLPLSHAGRWITDARGRVVILHGINMVYKIAPFYPSAAGFGDDDAAFLARSGFNVVRVGVLWEALEPQPGTYDQAYLAHLRQTVSTLARHGIVSLLDFHQDQYNERFEGEGFPSWSVQDDGLPAAPKEGFGNDYLVMPALERAFDHFWANSPGPGGVGLQDRYAAAWADTARYFEGNRNVLGYELMNEPWPGSVFPSCLQPVGCPAFDQGSLNPFYARVLRSIRAVDTRTLVWYEPNVLFNDGVNTFAGPLSDPRAGFAFHDYCLTEPNTGFPTGCDPFDDLVFNNAVGHVASTHEALLETEFGATDDTAYLNAEVQRADRYMVPWIEWAYCGCSDPTTSGPGDKQAIVRDPAKPPAGANLVLPTLQTLVEPYPQLIAGTPTSWSYNRSSRTFALRYSTARAGGDGRFATTAITEITAPPLVYNGRYGATVTGGRAVSKPGASTLALVACPGATTVTVTIRPSGPVRGSCRASAGHGRPAPRPHGRRPKAGPKFTG